MVFRPANMTRQLPKCVAPTGSVIKEKWSTASLEVVSSEISDCEARSHNLIVPSAEHVAKETPP